MSAPSAIAVAWGSVWQFVKHIVEMHGGTVTASSAGVGQGAKFAVLLPIAAALNDSPPANPHSDLEPIVEVARLDGVRILIVDDDADTCAVMSRILKETGIPLPDDR